jgi:preprotein translocase subunit SecD
MVMYYRWSGTLACAAMVLNLIIEIAILAKLRATLTLPGVAGLILTIGMSVDANVLIFERIREELARGKTVRASIEAGYKRAFSAILDSNVTTLITAVVLWQFGTGPVKGFATTLSIGIVVSMFTALTCTRVVYDLITSRRHLEKLSV